MPTYTPPLTDMAFVLHDVLRIEQSGTQGYGDLDRATTAAILAEAGKLAFDVLAPLNTTGDAEGCHFADGTVRTPAGFRAAYDALRAGGWMGLDCPEEFGGQGMPYLMHCATSEMFVSANMALNMYQGLTHGAILAIAAHADDKLKALYLPPMIDGRWSGTMNLTEPHCGTDLGLIRTRADPAGDGSYRLTGQKVWISAGEHDLTENIVHLVLARLPDAPAGVKGISLFLVPKFLPDGARLGARNAVTCIGLEDKMGIHGNATCVMQYDGAQGWLVGEAHKGMRAMFTMMNEARLGVGLQGLAVAAAAHQHAVAFARDRHQGRALGNQTGLADPILVHPDVRRMLMDQRAFVEGGRALMLWGASLIDRPHDPQAVALISLLTPVIKAFLTDRGFAVAVDAQQVPGGAGYTSAAGFEQFVRDARIAMIYEGTNGIQALDLVGRKLGADGGRAITGFIATVTSLVAEHAGNAALRADFLDPLDAAAQDLQTATMWLAERGTKAPEDALAGAHDFLHLFGYVCRGLMWALMAIAAQAGLDAGHGDAAFLRTKLAAGRHFMARHLPATALHLARLRAGGETVMALGADAF